MQPSETILEETPARALKFLGALSTNVAIRLQMATEGHYADEVHEDGYTRLLTAMGYYRPSPLPLPDNKAVLAAVVELDAWDEPNFRMIRAALEYRHPEQCELLFHELQADKRAAAVVGVARLLDRLDVLESGSDREDSREADHAALATLATRGYGPEERVRLRDLVRTAKALKPAPVKPVPPGKDVERRQALLDLWIWYHEWSEVARAVIKRRDYLIQLGLAKRKRSKDK